MAGAYRVSTVTILIPTFNEEKALPETIASIGALNPAPDEVLLVDGGSNDRTVETAEAAGFRCITSPRKGRGAQINLGVMEARGDIVCVLHADTHLPEDGVALMIETLADQRNALAGFMPRLVGIRARGGDQRCITLSRPGTRR